MKWLFWVLLLACLSFSAFVQWGEALLGESKGLQPLPPMNEGKIRVLKSLPAPQVPASAPAIATSAANAVPAQSACLEWGEFSGGDLARAASALDALRLGGSLTQRQVERTGGYWVYIPPRPTRSELDKKISQIKSLGIEEYFIVQEPGKWHNAISLGVFRNEEAAQRFLAKMREKGIKSALAGERSGKFTLTVFVLKNPDAEAIARVTQLQGEFPGSELKAVACE